MSESSSSEVLELQAANQDLTATINLLKQELELFKFKYEQLQQHVFGKKSEKKFLDSSEQLNFLNPDQAGTSDELEDSADYIIVSEHKKKRRSKKVFPKDLPVDEVVYEPVESHCSDCGEELKEFSRDEREEIEFEPARFFKRLIVKVNCSCPKCKKVESGKTPNPVIPGSQLGAGFFAHLVTSRFCDHLPYYRQSQMYERQGVFIPDKALSSYAMKLGSILQPVAREIKDYLLSLDYLQVDETRLEVLEKEQTHRGQLWVLNDPHSGLTYYEYHDSRSKSAASDLLEHYSSALQADAYTAYDDYQGFTLGCLAHARRYFVKASKIASRDCRKAVKMISELYGIEKELTKKKSNLRNEDWFQERLKVRQDEAVPILDNLREYLVKLKDHYLIEDHPVTTAINYMLNRYDTFCNYTTDGRYQIDNNDIERIIRPIAIGRKNWLFAGSHNAARLNAAMMTVVQTCRQLKINPQHYLSDVLPKLAAYDTKSLQGLTPMDWSKS